MLLANPLGLAVGALLSSSLATESRPQRVEVVLVIQAAAALACAAAALFLRAAPPSAPSGTAAYKRPGENLGRDLKSLHDNFGYLTLCNVFALAVGGFQALLTLLDQILQPAGYSSVDTGHISAVLILCGIVGAGAPLPAGLPCFGAGPCDISAQLRLASSSSPRLATSPGMLYSLCSWPHPDAWCPVCHQAKESTAHFSSNLHVGARSVRGAAAGLDARVQAHHGDLHHFVFPLCRGFCPPSSGTRLPYAGRRPLPPVPYAGVFGASGSICFVPVTIRCRQASQR